MNGLVAINLFLRGKLESSHLIRVYLLPDPPLAPPPLVSGIRMIRGTRQESFAEIARLERPPVARYTLARHCFNAVLQGQNIKWALGEAKRSHRKDQSRHATELLRLGHGYLAQRGGGVFHELSPMALDLGSGLSLPITFDARLIFPDREMAILYHFWRKSLTDTQSRLLLTALQSVLWAQPGCAGMPFEVLIAPINELYRQRRMRPLSNIPGKLASDDEFQAFQEDFRITWADYHDKNPYRRWKHNK